MYNNAILYSNEMDKLLLRVKTWLNSQAYNVANMKSYRTEDTYYMTPLYSVQKQDKTNFNVQNEDTDCHWKGRSIQREKDGEKI